MKALVLAVLAMAAAACGGGLFPADDGSPDGGLNDAPGCTVFITFDPNPPVAGPDTSVLATANVLGASGVPVFTWHVFFAGGEVATTPAQPSSEPNKAVTFPATGAGVYNVQVNVDLGVCPTGQADLNVLAPGANVLDLRLHVTPPVSADRPPLDKHVTVMGGASFSLGAVTIDSGVVATGAVRTTGGANVPAYLKLMPVAGREGFVEAFSAGDGTFTARVIDQPHDVLIIPSMSGIAPRLVRDWTPSQTLLTVDGGITISGTVRDPAGALMPGALVQATTIISAGGIAIEVPSTLATTNASGAFALHADIVPGAQLRFEITPPASTGLPRLVASSATFDTAQTVAVRYAAALTTRDLANTTVRRSGSAIAGADVALVGTLSSAGTVQAGATATASGEVRVLATADASGKLPSTRAPAAVLSAVTAVTAADLAVSTVDLTSGVPAFIDAPPRILVASTIAQPGGTKIAGAVMDLVPVGALALAGAPPLRVESQTAGALSLLVAAGGHYALRLSDPGGRGAPLVIGDVTAATIAASYTLGARLSLSGSLVLSGNPQPVAGASVQILCASCTGIERSRPIAEGVSNAAGDFSVAVPDPGTM